MWEVSCSECHDDEPTVVKIKGVKPAADLTALQVAKRMPSNYALVRATRAQLAAGAKILRCAIPGCVNPVTHFCVTKCKELCTKHERDGHAAAGGFAGHVRVPIAGKAAHLAAQERKDRAELLAVVEAQEVRELLEPHAATIQVVKAELQAAEAQLAKQRKGQQKHCQ